MKRPRVTEECKSAGCRKIVDGEYCATYLNPPYWWSDGRKCPIAASREAEQSVKLNPLKASKLEKKGSLNLGYKIRKYQHGSNKRGRYVDGGGSKD